jgi:hypothetical protein
MYFLATPLGKKKSLSASIAGEDQDKSKVDSKNIIDAQYDDVPEDKRQAREAYFKEYEVECRRKMASCFG